MPISPATAQTAHFHSTAPAGESSPAGRPSRFSALLAPIRAHHLESATALLILIAGIALRVLPCFGVPDRITVDEHLYMSNVLALDMVGPFNYPALVHQYVDFQEKAPMVMLPPTRFVYIVLGWAWDAVFHSGPKLALRAVAATFSVLSFLLAGVFAFRLGGIRMALATGALMAVAPLELMTAHRELADGVFAFWALLSLWLLWENLQVPGRLGWLAAYASTIAAMVLTKENAFFAAVGLGGIICVAALVPGIKLGKSEWSTVGATFAGGLLGLAVMVCLAGDIQTLFHTYHLLVTKAEQNTFAYDSGGGPWFRYIVDILLVSPAMLLPAIGGIFGLKKENRAGIYLLLFMLFSGVVMVNVRNGMNLRYSTMWDMPLRYLAAGMLLQVACAVRRAPILAAVGLVTLVVGIEYHGYWLLFVHHDIGDPIPQYLMLGREITRTVQM